MISRTLSNGPLDLRRASQRLGGYFSTPGAGLNVEIQILPTIEATSSTVECYQPEFRRGVLEGVRSKASNGINPISDGESSEQRETIDVIM